MFRVFYRVPSSALSALHQLTTNPVGRSLNTPISQMRHLGHSITPYTASDRTLRHHPCFPHALPHPLSAHQQALLTFFKYVPWNPTLLSILGAATFFLFTIGGQYGPVQVSQLRLSCSRNAFSAQGSKFPGKHEHWEQNPKPSSLSVKPPQCGPRPSLHRPELFPSSRAVLQPHSSAFNSVNTPRYFLPETFFP